MNRRRRIPFRVVAAIACGILTSCASTQLQRSEPSPEFESSQIRKVLVFAMAKSPDRRRAFEEEFAAQWKKRNVMAVASVTAFPDVSNLTKESVAAYARQQGFDTVLLGRLSKREAVQPQYAGAPEQVASDMNHDFQTLVASPQDPIDYELAIITTKLYDVAAEKLLWTGVSQTLIIEGKTEDVVRPFVKTILKSLYEKPK